MATKITHTPPTMSSYTHIDYNPKHDASPFTLMIMAGVFGIVIALILASSGMVTWSLQYWSAFLFIMSLHFTLNVINAQKAILGKILYRHKIIITDGIYQKSELDDSNYFIRMVCEPILIDRKTYPNEPLLRTEFTFYYRTKEDAMEAKLKYM